MSDDYRAEARRAAKAAGIDPDVFERQIHQESGFNPTARSPAGARGIAQFMPATAKGLGINPDNPVEALHGAAKLMASYEKKYGNTHDALVAYNAGPGRVGGKLPAETENYIKVILGAGGAKGRVPGKAATPSTPSDPAPASGQGAASARRAALQAYVLAQGTADQPDSVLNLARSLTAAQSAPDAKTALRSRRASAPRESPAPADHGGGTVDFDGRKVAGWIGDALTYAREHGWKGTVNSGFRTDAEQTRIYKSGVRPAAVPKSMGGGGSNHEGTVFPLGAVDVSEAQQLSGILQNSPYGKKLKWAGTKDPVHFSHPHGGSY